MQSAATTPEQYLEELPEERKAVMEKLRAVILENLPQGFVECMNYGMLGYVVPHSLYPDGYHCNPKLPLPFMNLASQKNFVAVYHMGIYGDKSVMDWFVREYVKHCKKKPDMGKSCIRFKDLRNVPYGLIGQLASKISVAEWISTYEKVVKTKRKR